MLVIVNAIFFCCEYPLSSVVVGVAIVIAVVVFAVSSGRRTILEAIGYAWVSLRSALGTCFYVVSMFSVQELSFGPC